MSVLERLKLKPENLNTNYRFPINIPILAELDFTEESFLEFVKKLEGITAVEHKELKPKKVSAVKAKMVMLEEGEEEDGDVVEAPFFFSPCPSSPSSALSSISAARVNHGALAQYSREHHLSGSGHFILGRTMIAASTGRRTMVSPRAMGAVATRPRRP